MKYLVGRPFKIAGDRRCVPGEIAPAELENSGNLYALLSAGYLYAIVPEDGYSKLPPHVYNAVRTQQEAAGLITKGEPLVPIVEWEEPEQVVRAREMFEAEDESHRHNAEVQQQRAEVVQAKFAAEQLSPRPIELPPEKMGVDSKKVEAEALAGAEEDEVNEYLDNAVVKDYAERTIPELKAEIIRRNGTRDNDHKLSTAGNKADLVSRLNSDDANLTDLTNRPDQQPEQTVEFTNLDPEAGPVEPAVPTEQEPPEPQEDDAETEEGVDEVTEEDVTPEDPTPSEGAIPDDGLGDTDDAADDDADDESDDSEPGTESDEDEQEPTEENTAPDGPPVV